MFLELMDHLGSTSTVVDLETSELVEQSTYQGYGGVDSDYRPERWKEFREDYRFTGKEEDIEVGLQYFGKRYYAPALQRWMSADPLAVHGLGADLNVYAYVHGTVLKVTDPTGLVEDPGDGGALPGGTAKPATAASIDNKARDVKTMAPQVDALKSQPTPAPTSDSSLESRQVGWVFPTTSHSFPQQKTIDTGSTLGNYALGSVHSLNNLFNAVVSTPFEMAGALEDKATQMGYGTDVQAAKDMVPLENTPLLLEESFAYLDANISRGVSNSAPALKAFVADTRGGIGIAGAAGQAGGALPTAHIALGLEHTVERQAASVGATHLMNDQNWKRTFMDALSGGTTKFTVFLDDLAGEGVYGKVMNSVTRNATGRGGATDFEISQLYQSKALGAVDFVEGGVPKENPFK